MFRRRRADRPDSAEGAAEEVAEEAARAGAPAGDAAGDPATVEQTGSSKPPRPDGPWDVSEVDLSGPAGAGRIDLGALLIRGAEGMQLQLQVEEDTGQITSALVVVADAAVQLLAVAEPRSTGVWAETRHDLARDARQRGGRVEEAEGPLGPELHVLLPVRLPDGQQGVQPSRVAGIDGPRWLLRATFLGAATQEQAVYERLAAVVRDTVVVRGDAPMPPGDLLPLRLPPTESPAGLANDEADPAAANARPTLADLDPGPTITEVR